MRTWDAPIKGKFKPSSSAEASFYRQLKKVAKAASKIVGRHADGATVKNEQVMMKELRAYATKIGPWAVKEAAKFTKQVANSNERAYQRNASTISKLLKTTVAERNTGDVAMALMAEQVGLIQSIPLEAGFRAQEIAKKNFLNGTRAQPDPEVTDRLVKEMGMTEEVAVNRAKLIARTEAARANSSFVQARALAVGSTHYIWRSSMDGTPPMRKSHGEMNGKKIAWDSPPVLSDGTQGHAGTLPNCRCYPDPVLPDLD